MTQRKRNVNLIILWSHHHLVLYYILAKTLLEYVFPNHLLKYDTANVDIKNLATAHSPINFVCLFHIRSILSIIKTLFFHFCYLSSLVIWLIYFYRVKYPYIMVFILFFSFIFFLYTNQFAIAWMLRCCWWRW